MDNKADDNSAEQDRPTISLRQFINDNDKLLAAIGIFVALAAYWSSLPLRSISSFLAFLCLLAVVPLLVEVWNGVDASRASWMLLIFINVFSILAGYTLWYILINFRPQWKTELSKVLLWTIFIPIWILLRKYKVDQRLYAGFYKKERKGIRKLYSDDELAEQLEENRRFHEKHGHWVLLFFQVVLFLALLAIADFIGSRLAPPLNRKLDQIYESYRQEEQPSPTPMPTQTPVPAPSATPSPTP